MNLTKNYINIVTMGSNLIPRPLGHELRINFFATEKTNIPIRFKITVILS